MTIAREKSQTHHALCLSIIDGARYPFNANIARKLINSNERGLGPIDTGDEKVRAWKARHPVRS